MSNLYNILSHLLNEKKITGHKMCKDLGISSSLMTDLKNGRKKGVNAKTAQKIADYFGVSVAFLLGQEEKPLADDDKELEEYLEMLKNRPECRMLFQLSKGCTKEEVEQAVRIIEAIRGN